MRRRRVSSRSDASPRRVAERWRSAAGDWRAACAAALDDGERFCGAFADGARDRAALARARSRAAPTTRVLAHRRRRGRAADDRRPRSRRRLGRARGARPATASRFAGHEPLRPLVAHPRRHAELDRPGRGRGRPPGRGRADPRRRDRVGPLPLPRRRRAHPAPRPAPLLQAPRARARRRGAALARGLAYRPARLRRLRGRQLGRLRAGRASSALGLVAARERCAARARCCSSSSASTTTSTTSPRSAPGSASRREHGLRRAEGAGACGSTSELTGHRFLFGTIEVGRQSRSSCRRPRPSAPGASCASWRGDAALGLARARASPPRSRRGSTAWGCSSADDAARLGARRPGGPRRRGRGTDARSDEPRPLVRPGFSPAVPPDAPTGDVAARLELRAARARGDLRAARRPARRAGLRPAPRRPGRRPARAIGVGRVESPRGETVCAVERDGVLAPATAPAHRLLRQLAGAGPRHARATSCPTSR